MEAAVQNLETLFRKTEADLNFISCKIQKEILEQESSSQKELDPIKVMHSFEEVKAEYKKLTKDVEILQKAQKDTVAAIQTELKTLSDLLLNLEDKSRIPVEMNPNC